MKTQSWSTYLRPVLYLIGLNVLALGTVLFTAGKLGVSSLVSVPQVLSMILPITLGQATTAFFILLVAIELIMLRKIKLQIVAQLLLAFVFGWIVDFYGIRVGLERMALQNIWEQLLITLLAIICTSVGIFLMVKAEFVLIPPDGVVNLVSSKLKASFGKTKFSFDLTMVILSVAISLTFIHHIEAIGIGTVLAVLLVGQLIRLWEHLTNRVAN
ncbi:YczE/YyaS/YitT family protein [Lactobacillaceae bacterium Scapto_B20]